MSKVYEMLNEMTWVQGTWFAGVQIPAEEVVSPAPLGLLAKYACRACLGGWLIKTYPDPLNPNIMRQDICQRVTDVIQKNHGMLDIVGFIDLDRTHVQQVIVVCREADV